MKPVLLDTGVIVAWLDGSEQFHTRAAKILDRLSGPFFTCESVIAEACYLLRRMPGASEVVIENVADGIFQIPFRLSESSRAVQRILRKFRDRGIDLADACLIHLASELRSAEILTLDSDFRIYRWGNNQAFHLLLQAPES